MSASEGAKSYGDALYEAFSYSLYLEGRPIPSPLKPTPEFEARFHRVAARFFGDRVEAIADACAVAAVDARRGRWIATFNGKI